jgi:uncharacterized protein with FMN-binding domain
VRKGTKSFISILSLGLVAAGYQAGQAAQISTGFSAAASPIAAGATSPTATTAPVASSTPITSSAPSSTPSTEPTNAASTTQAATPKATKTAIAPASTPKATTAAPAPVSTPKATTAAPAAGTTTKTGTAINYRYGTVQVSVTKASGKITAVNLLQEGATGGRQGAFSYLVDYAIQANGSSFGNLGGATYTTDAFKQSLESALAKF